jgi:hypothetical protein
MRAAQRVFLLYTPLGSPKPRNSLLNSLFAGNSSGDGCDQHCVASHLILLIYLPSFWLVVPNRIFVAHSEPKSTFRSRAPRSACSPAGARSACGSPTQRAFRCASRSGCSSAACVRCADNARPWPSVSSASSSSVIPPCRHASKAKLAGGPNLLRSFRVLHGREGERLVFPVLDLA